MANPKTIFQLNKVGLAYDKNTDTSVEALLCLDLTIEAGERLAVIGPSGCGKSTLLYLLSGLLKPTSGQVFYDDQLLQAPQADIALILQDYGLFPWKTVYQNVALGLKIQKMPKSEQRIAVNKILTNLGILDQSKKYPAQLSGGQKQRVAIARALVLKPRVLLLDEPFAALDAITKDGLEKLLLNISRQENLTLVFVTHNIEEAVCIGDRILVFGQDQGKIAQIIDNSDPAVLLERHGHVFYEKCQELRAGLGLFANDEIPQAQGGGLDNEA